MKFTQQQLDRIQALTIELKDSMPQRVSLLSEEHTPAYDKLSKTLVYVMVAVGLVAPKLLHDYLITKFPRPGDVTAKYGDQGAAYMSLYKWYWTTCIRAFMKRMSQGDFTRDDIGTLNRMYHHAQLLAAGHIPSENGNFLPSRYVKRQWAAELVYYVPVDILQAAIDEDKKTLE